MHIRERIISLVKDYLYKPLIFEEMVSLFKINKAEINLFLNVLNELETEGIIVKTSKGKYVTPEMINMVVGTIDISEKGFGFVNIRDSEDKDIYISPEHLNNSINGDTVLVKIICKSKKKSAEGEIVKVLKRTSNKLVGVFKNGRGVGFVKPDDKTIKWDIIIPKEESKGASTGCKVLVEIIYWPDNKKRKNAEGKILEILGISGQPGVDILSIIKSYNIEDKFPVEVLYQVKTIPRAVEEREISKRRDLRDLNLVTIDGEDAKDLDDAISIYKNTNGNYILGVHIADVSYYVNEGSPLDQEAVKRGTSVYFVDRVIPMLPKELSNGICSLNVGQDRLAFSVIMEIDCKGNVISHEIFKSVINVNERMTYLDVTKILLDNDLELIKRYENHIQDFKIMQELAKILKKKREERGSIDFNFPEIKVILDSNGKPIEIKKYETTISNSIIEEFMLICNETVAERMFWSEVPFIYRIHQKPDAEKIEFFNKFLNGLGYSIKGINKLHPKAMQDIVKQVKGRNEEKIISTLMLRSLQQAIYSHRNEGHFGLATKYYCHFTSPIRRYPDLFIHRVINEMLESKFVIDDKKINKLTKLAVEVSKTSSERERIAEQAEREVEDLKKVEFMVDKLGEVFKGVISSVASFGFFVELPNLIEGLVHVENLRDDYYIFDREKYHLVGERLHKVFKIGDEVTVKLVKVNIELRRLDFILK